MTRPVFAKLTERLMERLVWNQLRQVLRRCEQVVERSSLGRRWRGLGWVYWRKFVVAVVHEFWSVFGLLILLLPGAAGLLYWAAPPESRNRLIVWIIVIDAILAVFLAWLVDKEAVAQKWRDHESKLARLSYQQIWRPLIEQHLSLTQQPYRVLIEQLAYEHDDINSKYTAAIHAHAARDYAPGCLALAQRFLR